MGVAIFILGIMIGVILLFLFGAAYSWGWEAHTRQTEEEKSQHEQDE